MTQEQIEAVRADLPERLMELADKLTAKHAGLLRHSATAMRDLTKANEELRADVEELRAANSDNDELLTIAWMDGAHRSAKGVRQAIEERDATIDRLTKERDVGVEIRDRALLLAGERKEEVRDLRTRLSAMQEAIDEAVRRADTETPFKTHVIVSDVVEPLRPFATKPEVDPEVDPLVEALREIVDPLAYMKARAEQQDAQLSGMAYSIANDAEYLRGIARTALAARGSRVVFDGREG